jgi:uncharacterized coiled-coil DUF342 family protein
MSEAVVPIIVASSKRKTPEQESERTKLNRKRKKLEVVEINEKNENLRKLLHDFSKQCREMEATIRELREEREVINEYMQRACRENDRLRAELEALRALTDDTGSLIVEFGAL